MRNLMHRMRTFLFTEQTRDKLAAWLVFVGVPLMLLGVVAVLIVVGSWVSKAQEREVMRAERMSNVVEEIVEEIRQPDDGGNGDSREETFDRIRQLCEAEPGCEP